jgi:hypothetical protein
VEKEKDKAKDGKNFLLFLWGLALTTRSVTARLVRTTILDIDHDRFMLLQEHQPHSAVAERLYDSLSHITPSSPVLDYLAAFTHY